MENYQQDPPDFSSFIERTRSSEYGDFVSTKGLKVAGEAEFRKMKQFILNKYDGIDVRHSFVDDAGQVWDCIPIEQQPALKKSGAKLATPPPFLPGSKKATEEPVNKGILLQSHDRKGELDKFGNERSCPPGTIPMRRITLVEMTRFKTFHDFFQKGPDGSGRHMGHERANAAASTHKYAYAYQQVNNVGGESTINIWQPAINTGVSEIFSLSQQWYVGGSGTGLQTVECGWQVYPGKYGNTNPNLFIFWTADGYGNTGCYNLDCPAFVQTNPNYHLGAAWSPVSTAGGQQIEMYYAFYLYQGNWWLYLGVADASHAIGYYPASIFNGGALATGATLIEYGGETVGDTSWPPMGGGAFANEGFQQAAYHRDIRFYPPGSPTNEEADLSGSQPSPGCYTIDVENVVPPWNEYFFFGGPGGSSC